MRPIPATVRAAVLAETPSQVLEALDGIRRLLEAQNARLDELERRERDARIMRHLVEIRRGLGLMELHQPPGGHTRRRPLGTS